MYVSYKDDPRVAMFLIYGQESHPVAARTPRAEENGPAGHVAHPRGPDGPFALGDPHRNLAERAEAARQCAARLRLSVPILLDTLDGQAARALNCRFGVTLIANQEGKIVYYHEGAQGIDPAGARRVLQQVLEQKKP